MKIFRYFKKIIETNPVKVFLMLCLFALTGLSIHFTRLITLTSRVHSSFEYGDKWCYVIGSDVNSLSIAKFDNKVEIVNGKITYQEADGIAGLFIVLAALLGLLLFIFSVIGNDETDWGFKDNWYEVSVDEIVCELEDGIYYYMYKGRLIYQQKNKLDRRSFVSKIREFNREGKNMYPEFLTKSQRREEKIKEILT